MSENSSKGIFSKNGLFRGFTAQLARDPFGYSIYFVPYTIILRWGIKILCLTTTSALGPFNMDNVLRRFLIKTA